MGAFRIGDRTTAGAASSSWLGSPPTSLVVAPAPPAPAPPAPAAAPVLLETAAAAAPPEPPAAPAPPAPPVASSVPTAPTPRVLSLSAPVPPMRLSTTGASMGVGPADAVLGDAPAGTPSGAGAAEVTSEAPVAASGAGLGVGAWLSANVWWPGDSDAASKQPLIPEYAVAESSRQNAAARGASWLEILRAARSAAIRVVGSCCSFSDNPSTGATAAEAQVSGSAVNGIDGASESAAD